MCTSVTVLFINIYVIAQENCNVKTAILNWLQNDGTKGFFVDQLKVNKFCQRFNQIL